MFILFQDPQSDIISFPWSLEADESREAELSFTAEDVTIPHKLRGFLSYSQVVLVVIHCTIMLSSSKHWKMFLFII